VAGKNTDMNLVLIIGVRKINREQTLWLFFLLRNAVRVLELEIRALEAESSRLIVPHEREVSEHRMLLMTMMFGLLKMI